MNEAGKGEAELQSLLTLALEGGRWSASQICSLYPGKSPQVLIMYETELVPEPVPIRLRK